MGTGRRRRPRESLWIPAAGLTSTTAHPFHQRQNDILDDAGLEAFIEEAFQAC
jgi:hypothetical protein